jgi:hypothetical protein
MSNNEEYWRGYKDAESGGIQPIHPSELYWEGYHNYKNTVAEANLRSMENAVKEATVIKKYGPNPYRK